MLSLLSTLQERKRAEELAAVKQLGVYDVGQTIGTGTFSKVVAYVL